MSGTWSPWFWRGKGALVVPAEAVEAAVPGRRTSGSAPAKDPALYIPSLDGLRAIAFLIVFVSHAGLEVVPSGFGVTVFFFLSGYLITTLMRVEHEKTGHVNLRHFYLRRALRILPPFYLVLACATALAYLGCLGTDVKLMTAPIVSQALHYSNYRLAFHGTDGMAPGTGVYWSLAVEEHFYLTFPIAFLALSRRNVAGRTKAFWLWGACVAILVWRCALVLLTSATPERIFFCSDTRLDSIAFGCALGAWQNPVLDATDHWLGGTAARGPWLSLLGLGLLVATFLIRSPGFRETFRYTLQGLALTPIFIAAIRWPHWGLFRALNWRLLRFMGTLSYCLYLIHRVALEAVEHALGMHGIRRAAVALGISLLIAWVIHVFVERPCARLRRRLAAVNRSAA
jgi:peptidoglycan/LPS O-acetylase OafA/YrhL